jgi:hypothetical protein
LQAVAVGFFAHGGRSLMLSAEADGDINGAERGAFLSRKSDKQARKPWPQAPS